MINILHDFIKLMAQVLPLCLILYFVYRVLMVAMQYVSEAYSDTKELYGTESPYDDDVEVEISDEEMEKIDKKLNEEVAAAISKTPQSKPTPAPAPVTTAEPKFNDSQLLALLLQLGGSFEANSTGFFMQEVPVVSIPMNHLAWVRLIWAEHGNIGFKACLSYYEGKAPKAAYRTLEFKAAYEAIEKLNLKLD